VIVEQAVETARPLIDERGHELTVTLPDCPVMLRGDKTRLAQILANLLHNAAKYTEEGGSIALTVTLEGSEVAISIKDNGPGIAPEDASRLFELFARGVGRPGRTSMGLGIGLALVERLAKMHGGRVAVQSDGIGRGSEFVVRLPVVPMDAVTPQPVGASELPPDHVPPRRVLIADDNHDAAEALKLLLEFAGHDVRTACDGPSALAAAEAFRPDVALSISACPSSMGVRPLSASESRCGAGPWCSSQSRDGAPPTRPRTHRCARLRRTSGEACQRPGDPQDARRPRHAPQHRPDRLNRALDEP
jgi:two-component system, sensor histidine kinase